MQAEWVVTVRKGDELIERVFDGRVAEMRAKAYARDRQRENIVEVVSVEMRNDEDQS